MTQATLIPPKRAVPAAVGPRPKLGKVSSGTVQAARIVLNAVEGFGKTTFGAFAPNPAVLMSRGETGFKTLRQKNLVPDADAVEIESWAHGLETIDQMIDGPHETLVLDALGGFERLCHEDVCTKHFNGDWGEKGFGGFQRGFDVAIPEWLKLLQKIDQWRQARGGNVVILAHCRTKTIKNPLGPDFDRYVAECHDKTWGTTHKWADCVLFGNFVSVIQEDKKTKRPKGIGGTERAIYTQRTDAYDAKNRYGMPETLTMGDGPSMWRQVWDAIVSIEAPAAPEL